MNWILIKMGVAVRPRLSIITKQVPALAGTCFVYGLKHLSPLIYKRRQVLFRH